ncbi:helix-turn-helix domain-containing protein [Pseudomonas luteola]|uniref:helix-turn-helix domain-containing protein n=1 Tax=Pseudomonas luteola TaxID=47886 RepID=UPI001EF55F08|nr:helix-turn-helix domain-containing protein [Pseudomonas luteola]MCG7373259.1 helix-turn-helix domain-containing protein [Pseudomonas luteola]
MHLNISSSNASLWTPKQAACELGVSVRTLATWRSTGRHTLPYAKVGRLVRYREQDVRAWLFSRLHNGTVPVEGAVN